MTAFPLDKLPWQEVSVDELLKAASEARVLIVTPGNQVARVAAKEAPLKWLSPEEAESWWAAA